MMNLSEQNNKVFLSQYDNWLNNIYPSTPIVWMEYYKNLENNIFKKRDIQKNYLFSGDINFNAHVLKFIQSLHDKYEGDSFTGSKNITLNQYGCVIFDTLGKDIKDDKYYVEAISETWFEINDKGELEMFIPNIVAGAVASREVVVAETNELGELIIDC